MLLKQPANNFPITDEGYMLQQLRLFFTDLVTKVNALQYIHSTIYSAQDMGGANGTSHYPEWDGSELYKDSLFSHSVTANPSRISVNESGRYSIYWNIGITQGGSARTTFMSSLRINGSVVDTKSRQRNYSRGSGYGDSSVGVKTEIDLDAGDYVEACVTVEDTDGVYVSDTIPEECELIIRKI